MEEIICGAVGAAAAVIGLVYFLRLLLFRALRLGVGSLVAANAGQDLL